jgi:antitoxin component HigA of HigAB toxin-antitoxin module
MRTRVRKLADTYFDLVREFPLRRLASAAEHARAKEIYLRVSSSHPDAGSRDYLNVLADLVAEYEKRMDRTVDTSGLSAADLIRHRLRERKMSVNALAKEIGMPQSNLSDMLNGRREWSKAAIRSLTKMFRLSAERFLQ